MLGGQARKEGLNRQIENLSKCEIVGDESRAERRDGRERERERDFERAVLSLLAH